MEESDFDSMDQDHLDRIFEDEYCPECGELIEDCICEFNPE